MTKVNLEQLLELYERNQRGEPNDFINKLWLAFPDIITELKQVRNNFLDTGEESEKNKNWHAMKRAQKAERQAKKKLGFYRQAFADQLTSYEDVDDLVEDVMSEVRVRLDGLDPQMMDEIEDFERKLEAKVRSMANEGFSKEYINRIVSEDLSERQAFIERLILNNRSNKL